MCLTYVNLPCFTRFWIFVSSLSVKQCMYLYSLILNSTIIYLYIKCNIELKQKLKVKSKQKKWFLHVFGKITLTCVFNGHQRYFFVVFVVVSFHKVSLQIVTMCDCYGLIYHKCTKSSVKHLNIFTCIIWLKIVTLFSLNYLLLIIC